MPMLAIRYVTESYNAQTMSDRNTGCLPPMTRHRLHFGPACSEQGRSRGLRLYVSGWPKLTTSAWLLSLDLCQPNCTTAVFWHPCCHGQHYQCTVRNGPITIKIKKSTHEAIKAPLLSCHEYFHVPDVYCGLAPRCTI